MKPAFSQTEISTGTNSDDDAFFANALANPPIPADLTLAQARDVLDSLASLSPAIPSDVVVTHIDANGASEGETRVSNPADALALLENLKATAALYLGSTSSKDPRANPLYADLTGLPPFRLMVGSIEALRDDSTRFAEAAGARGVDVRVEIWQDLHHGWYLFPNQINATERT